MEKRAQRSNVVLVVSAYENDALRMFTADAMRVEQHGHKIKVLDKDLLPLLERYLNPALRGILVKDGDLGGFASTRLILCSLNVIAWLHDVPIQAVDPGKINDVDAIRSLADSIAKKRQRFTTPLMPHYSLAADVTPSKKKKKFTIR